MENSWAEGVEVVGDVLAALADPTRRQIVELLAHDLPATASQLASKLPVSRQAVVKHLAVLADAGLTDSTRVGREVRHVLRPAGLRATTDWMSALAADWDRRLERIKMLAESQAIIESGTVDAAVADRVAAQRVSPRLRPDSAGAR